jgi:DNA polymerase-3 subunit chi
MTRVDFYVLDSSELAAQKNFACRLTEKAWHRGHSVYIHTDNEQQAEELDELLWSFRPNSFVPHALLNADFAHAGEAKIEIGYGEDAGDHHEVLINLSSELPSFFARFERISEVVVQDEQVLNGTRKRFKYYRERGYPLKSHKV